MATMPILYSFRRCPFAIRARMALFYSGCCVELREVLLKDKPASLLAYSPKGTVPVLVLDAEHVLDESVEIAKWAVQQHDPRRLWRDHWQAEFEQFLALIDGPFKAQLDQYKYWQGDEDAERVEIRQQAVDILTELSDRLAQHPYILGQAPSLLDLCVFPIIRQFAFVDKTWFDHQFSADLLPWLNHFLQSPMFSQIMQKYPQWRQGDRAIMLGP